MGEVATCAVIIFSSVAWVTMAVVLFESWPLRLSRPALNSFLSFWPMLGLILLAYSVHRGLERWHNRRDYKAAKARVVRRR